LINFNYILFSNTYNSKSNASTFKKNKFCNLQKKIVINLEQSVI